MGRRAAKAVLDHLRGLGLYAAWHEDPCPPWEGFFIVQLYVGEMVYGRRIPLKTALDLFDAGTFRHYVVFHMTRLLSIGRQS